MLIDLLVKRRTLFVIERDVAAPVTFYWAADLSPASSTIITAAAKSGRFGPERGGLDVSGAAVIDPPR
jgi:hypothetical protein